MAVDATVHLGVTGQERPAGADCLTGEAPLQGQRFADEMMQVAGTADIAKRAIVDQQSDEHTIRWADHREGLVGHSLHQLQRVDGPPDQPLELARRRFRRRLLWAPSRHRWGIDR